MLFVIKFVYINNQWINLIGSHNKKWPNNSLELNKILVVYI